MRVYVYAPISHTYAYIRPNSKHEKTGAHRYPYLLSSIYGSISL